MTPREQSMYFRLVETFPDHVVLAQVAFSAILTTKDRPTRATFDRKVCDFVLCSKGFEVIAVIELDDASHQGREQADAKRQALLTRAGYRVERFAQIPDAGVLRARLMPPAPSAANPQQHPVSSQQHAPSVVSESADTAPRRKATRAV
ncbi:DUF2726 domain-containing protein [Roseateles depolymerans]|uniref:DUF2726 domain-containing protein n=1 Tax=Roseateles depolymerans TaxID=76731 RepID=UPI00214EA076|nr:DUF2726 domain-containing protein [Roseateles depolymerans]